jgi:hypothetical protein
MSHEIKKMPALFGVMGEFSSVKKLQHAAEAASKAGFSVMDAYSPFPIEGLAELMGKKRTRLPRLVFIGGVTGLITGLALQIFTTVVDYPMNIGGRPLLSLPSFVPVSYELTILLASLSAAIGMLVINGFPEPHHPLFNVKDFEKASRDGFFLCIESGDPKFDASQVGQFLKGAGAEKVYDVPN